MSNLSKSKLGKFAVTIFALSSISAILTTAQKAEAFPTNTIMQPGSSITSNNQCFSLNAQTDGNLVLYRRSNGQALWHTGTYGKNVKQTIFQTDGNLVIYNTSNSPVWASNTERRGAAQIYVQDDGNVVMYNSQNQALWHTNTVTSCGNSTPTPARPTNPLINNMIMQPGSSITSNNQCFSLNAQTDGNLVLYRRSNGQALWHTATNGKNVKQTIFQNDGNLVIYNTSNSPVWASNTERRGATKLTVQDDGNVVMSNSQNQALWATNTNTSCSPPATPTPPTSTAHSTSQSNIKDFVARFNGKMNISRDDFPGSYGGQCVTLIARYLEDYYGGSKDSRYPMGLDNGRGTAQKVANIFSQYFSPVSDPSDPIPGSIISFPNAPSSGNCGTIYNPLLCGHVALVVSSQRNGNNLNVQILDSNGDGKALNGTSIVTQRSITIDTRYSSASGYGSGIYWVNPKN
jgi:uncharacterized membrane protein YcaP (DUF421 family)